MDIIRPDTVDAVVIGNGHAGIEAARALSRLGQRTVMVTFDATAMGRMSCNPSIGGLAKGQLVREIDALGGLMGRLIDRTGIHYRMLNRRKGPAVHAPRAQADKADYSRQAFSELSRLENLTIVEAEVTDIVTESVISASGSRSQQVTGVKLIPTDWALVKPGGAHSSGPEIPGEPPPGIVRLTSSAEISTAVVILTVGTFLKAKLFTGMDACQGGRRGEPPASGLSQSLQNLGLQLGRLKTGTPPRLLKTSIDFSRTEKQDGDDPPPRFSYFETTEPRNQTHCYITRTNEKTHSVIRASLDRSPLFGGLIKGVGPRYCPSIEDKINTFPDRDSHQIFLEPEGLQSLEVYPNGISTSLPLDVQLEYVRTIPGLELAEIVHPGYAVEYDFLLTSQIDSTLAVTGIKGLFSSGQINGTSGYEEAAAQGLIAGINAAALLSGSASFIPGRDQAYIGVLIDDLVTKIPTEPYRMFTSHSEYRLMLRQDNADRRLSPIGYELGLLSADELQQVSQRWDTVSRARAVLQKRQLKRSDLDHIKPPPNDTEICLAEIDLGKTLEHLLKRPGLTLATLRSLGIDFGLSESDEETIEAEIKYAGYIAKQQRHINRVRLMEDIAIPTWIFESPPMGLSREGKEKLLAHQPQTLGQALRIPGITQSDGFIISILIKSKQKRDK